MYLIYGAALLVVEAAVAGTIYGADCRGGSCWNYKCEMYLIDGTALLVVEAAVAGAISVKCTS